MLYDRISQEHQRLCQQISSLQAELANYPAGQLICCHQGTRCKWYHSDGHSRTYIPKKQRSYAEQLAAKKYLESLLKDLNEEKEALQSYLKKHPNTHSHAAKLLNEIPAYSELLSPYFKTDKENLLEWQNSPYEKKPNHPENLIHKASNRSFVRSKSEAMIDMVLYSHRIPFRYECALYLGNHPIFPDFTIRHPKTGETFYWEHFGMMDDALYAQNTASKLQLYISHGIVPSIHLITTYETKDHPLSIEIIQKTVEHYFL